MRKIDIHAHYGKWPFAGRDAEVEDIIRTMEKYDVEAFFMSSSKAIMYDFVEGNKELFSTIENVKGIYGYVVVNSNYPQESLQELRKYENHPRFIGVKYHPEYCKKPADCKEMDCIYDFVQEKDVPVLIHSMGDGISSPLKLLNINKKFPYAKLIAAHMGGSRYDLGIELAMKGNENILLEFCATDISSDKIALAVKAAGKERVLFGTDYSLFDPAYIIGAVESSDIDEEVKRNIYRENALKIFNRYNNGK